MSERDKPSIFDPADAMPAGKPMFLSPLECSVLAEALTRADRRLREIRHPEVAARFKLDARRAVRMLWPDYSDGKLVLPDRALTAREQFLACYPILRRQPAVAFLFLRDIR